MRVSRVETVVFSMKIALEQSRKEAGLVRKQDEVIRGSITTDLNAVRLAIDQFLNVKHEGCVVRTSVCALRYEGSKAVRWARLD